MKKYFITGLVTLLPLAVTIWVVGFLVDLLTKPFIGAVTILTQRLPIASTQLIHNISQVLILAALFFTIWFLGFVARKFFFNQLIRLGDYFLIQIPLVNTVYKTSKEIVKSLFGSKEKSFQQVVMLPFPYKGAYCIGLIAKHAPQGEPDTYSVFIPTTPNPATGFLVMCPKSELIHLDMSTEEAIKYVVSCGVIQPSGVPK